MPLMFRMVRLSFDVYDVSDVYYVSGFCVLLGLIVFSDLYVF